MRRFDMRLPAIVKFADASVDELLTETQNVSARGVFLYLDRHARRRLSHSCDSDFSAARHPDRTAARPLQRSRGASGNASPSLPRRHRRRHRGIRIPAVGGFG